MPIPISVTNPKGVGLAAASPAELPTSGPFARLGGAQASSSQLGSKEGAAAQQQAVGSNVDQAAAGAAQANGMAKEECSIETHHLNFWYPGVGEYPL